MNKNSVLKEILYFKTQIINFFYLSLVHGVNLLLPLILFPLLLSSLGQTVYGKVIFAQAIGSYFLAFTGFGFNVSATRLISIYRNDNDKISDIFFSVISIKIVLAIFSAVIVSLFCYFIGLSKNDVFLYAFSVLICFADALFPLWYFQGVEKMKYITIINLISRLLGALLIVFFVKNPDDYLLVPILFFVGNLFGALISLYIAIFKEGLLLKITHFKNQIFYIKESFVFVLSDLAAILKDKGNITFIGLFLGADKVVYYDLAEKIVWAFRSVFVNLNLAFFPFVSKDNNPKNTKKIIWVMVIISVLAYLFLVYFSDFFILFISRNDNMLYINSFLYIMALYIIIATFSSSVGQFVMVVNGLRKEFLINLILSNVLYFLLLGMLYLLNLVSILNLVVVFNLVVFFELANRIYLSKNKGYLSWIF